MNGRIPDIRQLARRQRWILWLVLVALLSQFLFVLPWGRFFIVGIVVQTLLQLALVSLMIVGVVLLLTARGTHPALIVICGILMLAPCANLLVLLLVNMGVTRTLRRAGLHVGFMGSRRSSLIAYCWPIAAAPAATTSPVTSRECARSAG